MSKEHVWPSWVRERLPEGEREKPVTYVYRDSAQGGEFRRVEQQPLFDLKIRSVCKSCNEGWMSRIELGASHVATGLLEGRGRELHAGGQTALARWAVLKALVGQLVFRGSPKESIPPSHYAELFEVDRDSGAPPRLVTVTMGRTAWRDGQAEAGFHGFNGIARGADKSHSAPLDGYLLTFSCLDIVFQVMRLYGEERAEYVHNERLEDAMQRIWPPSDSFIFPFGPALTQVGIRSIAGEVGFRLPPASLS
jgi:hypothetical protein